jgi:hypothetical protein
VKIRLLTLEKITVIMILGSKTHSLIPELDEGGSENKISVEINKGG